MTYKRQFETEMVKDGVTYEVTFEGPYYQINIVQVVILEGGIQKTETEIDPEVFQEKLKDHEWEQLREVIIG